MKLLAIMIVATVDDDAGLRDTKAFVVDALETFGGCRHPDDPLFQSLEIKSATVKHIGDFE